MCLILVAYDCHPRYRLILAANRDEFHQRPTAPAHFWNDAHQVLAGRDLQGGGTWMGVTRQGRLAAVTNFRDPSSLREGAPSRGALVIDFLLETCSGKAYLAALEKRANAYNGFNLVVWDGSDLCWYANRGTGIETMPPGIHGISNALLDTDWPKVELGMRRMKRWIDAAEDPDLEAGFEMLADRTPASDHRLPNTGVGLAWERLLSPMFITSPHYGTRASTLVLMDRAGGIRLAERNFGPDGNPAGPNATRVFSFSVDAECGP